MVLPEGRTTPCPTAPVFDTSRRPHSIDPTPRNLLSTHVQPTPAVVASTPRGNLSRHPSSAPRQIPPVPGRCGALPGANIRRQRSRPTFAANLHAVPAPASSARATTGTILSPPPAATSGDADRLWPRKSARPHAATRSGSGRCPAPITARHYTAQVCIAIGARCEPITNTPEVTGATGVNRGTQDPPQELEKNTKNRK